MYVDDTYYEAYTSDDAPANFAYLESVSTVYLKSIYPNFPSEDMLENLDLTTVSYIKNAICEQIKLGDVYGGSDGSVNNFSVGSFSITGGDTKGAALVSKVAKFYLDACGISYRGISSCYHRYR